MAHHSYTRVGGVWNSIPILFDEYEDLDAKTFKSINGDEGGVWAPASVIIIGGLGLQVTGPFDVPGTATIGTLNADEANIANTLTATFLVADELTVTTGTITDAFTVNGTTNCNDGLNVVNGISIGTGGMVVNTDDIQCVDGAGIQIIGAGVLDVAGNAAIGGTATIDTADTQTTNAVALNVTNIALLPRIRRGGGGVVVTGDATYSIADSCRFVAYAGTANCTVTFLDSGAQNGESVEFCSTQITEQLTVDMPLGTFPTPSYSLSNNASFKSWVRFTRMAGAWYLTGYSNGG